MNGIYFIIIIIIGLYCETPPLFVVLKYVQFTKSPSVTFYHTGSKYAFDSIQNELMCKFRLTLVIR